MSARMREGASRRVGRAVRASGAAGLAAALAALVVLPAAAQDVADDPDLLGTYSIIARDAETGEVGVGVQSRAFAAGNRAMHAKGGVAVIAHQASANPMYGAIGLELLEAGYTPQEALDMMVRSDEGRDRRQVAILDVEGRSAAWTGSGASDWKGHTCGTDYCAQGNILSGPEVVEAMARSFEGSSGPLADRLMDALDAAEAAGGDARGKQSGAILVVRPRVRGGFSDRVVDIRVDDHRRPLAELRRILDLQSSRRMAREAGGLLDEGDVDGGLALALAARDRSPENARAWVVVARALLESGRDSEALSALREAVELNPYYRTRLSDDEDFESIRGHPGFRRLVDSGG